MKKFYITTPIYYVNDIPHIGHAYTTLACDVIARFKRLTGYNVHFLTGTDEHGQKIENSALKNHLKPQEMVDKLSISFTDLLHSLHIENDDFIRTTEKRHTDYVQKTWQILIEKKYIYLGKYSGWYAISDECFYKESELVNNKAPTGSSVEWIEEESYFFRLSNFQSKLLEFYKQNPDFIQPKSRYNEIITFVEQGLQDLSISRTSFRWGIPVPNQPQHVIYVWFDALCNYLSAIQDKYEMWPCDLHMVGKDITIFHAVYWSAFLMALDLPLPNQVYAHGWWTNDGVKISKSLGNAIDPITLINQLGVDAVRYFLMREIPFGNDGNYSKKALVTRVNSELVNNIGNLVQRVLIFVYNHCDATVPAQGELIQEDQLLLDYGYSVVSKMKQYIDQKAINMAIGEIVNLGTQANIYMDKMAPWRLRHSNTERMHSVLYVLLEITRIIAIILQPFVPSTSKKALAFFHIYEVLPLFYASAGYSLNSGDTISQPSPIFSRLAEVS